MTFWLSVNFSVSSILIYFSSKTFDRKQIQPHPRAEINRRQYKRKDDRIVCHWRWLVRKLNNRCRHEVLQKVEKPRAGGKELFKKLFKIKIQSREKVRPNKTCKENRHEYWCKKETETRCHSRVFSSLNVTDGLQDHLWILGLIIWRHCATEEPSRDLEALPDERQLSASRRETSQKFLV